MDYQEDLFDRLLLSHSDDPLRTDPWDDPAPNLPRRLDS